MASWWKTTKPSPPLSVPSTIELSVTIRISVCSRWVRDRFCCFCTGKALSTGLSGVFAGGGRRHGGMILLQEALEVGG